MSIYPFDCRKVLLIWGDYIVASLPDPGNQLCTDDFEGRSPHNVNLAAKVCTLAVYYLHTVRTSL